VRPSSRGENLWFLLYYCFTWHSDWKPSFYEDTAPTCHNIFFCPTYSFNACGVFSRPWKIQNLKTLQRNEKCANSYDAHFSKCSSYVSLSIVYLKNKLHLYLTVPGGLCSFCTLVVFIIPRNPLINALKAFQSRYRIRRYIRLDRWEEQVASLQVSSNIEDHHKAYSVPLLTYCNVLKVPKGEIFNGGFFA
jgi:hypothetical protein